VILHHLFGRQGEPLSDADVGEFGRLKDFKEYQVFGARIFDVVTASRGDVADASRSEVVRARRCRSPVDRDASGSLQEEVPLIRSGVCSGRSAAALCEHQQP
jgi:hypothetical protein